MGTMSGWGLTARLVTKHFGVLGDQVAGMIAAFDPETATEADRDHLQSVLLQTAEKLVAARKDFDREHNDVTTLQQLIATDSKAAETLAARLAAGTISEETVNAFCDELEANKAKLPTEIQEESDAKDYMNELQQVVDGFSKQLAAFDAKAKQAKQMLSRAEAQQDLQKLRTQRQQELTDMQGLGNSSTALNALLKKAQKMDTETQALKMVTDINQKPLDQAAEINKIRAEVSAGPAESTLDRLKRLGATTAA